MTSMGIAQNIHDPDVDRVRELASIGAGHAATALARLVGRPCRMRVPTVRFLPPENLGAPFVTDASDDERRGMAGIFFEVEGGLGGVLALLFPAETRDRIVALLLGGRPGEAAPDTAASALREVGNILASHAVSSLADILGVAVLPSIPVLALEDAPTALASLVSLRRGGRAAVRVETEIFDAERELRGLLVLVPDSLRSIAVPRVV